MKGARSQSLVRATQRRIGNNNNNNVRGFSRTRLRGWCGYAGSCGLSEKIARSTKVGILTRFLLCSPHFHDAERRVSEQQPTEVSASWKECTRSNCIGDFYVTFGSPCMSWHQDKLKVRANTKLFILEINLRLATHRYRARDCHSSYYATKVMVTWGRDAHESQAQVAELLNLRPHVPVNRHSVSCSRFQGPSKMLKRLRGSNSLPVVPPICSGPIAFL